MTVHKKLMQARVKLQNIQLKKSGLNKFAGYQYFELGDFLPHIQAIFNEIGLCGVVSYETDYASLTITDVEDSTVIVIRSPMAEAQLKGTHPIQNLGAVETYQRRYLWMTAMEIVEHDAIDSSAGAEPAPKASPKPVEKPKAPAKLEGKTGAWQISVTTDKDQDMAAWISVVLEATRLLLNTAQSEKDVMDIFKVNRVVFDTLKSDAPDDYAVLMADFKQRKDKFKESE